MLLVNWWENKKNRINEEFKSVKKHDTPYQEEYVNKFKSVACLKMKCKFLNCNKLVMLCFGWFVFCVIASAAKKQEKEVTMMTVNRTLFGKMV